RRDTLEKKAVALADIEKTVIAELDDIQKNMLEKSRKLRDERIVTATNTDEILQGVEKGCFVKADWCGCRECEDKVKEIAQATSRVMVEGETVTGKCAVCGKEAKHVVIFARAY
ncbi:MAG: proline--tRNA ligase, partial [Clostridia bacterium]|nr:proline--tRNA ligase [Clostridia bacterium]